MTRGIVFNVQRYCIHDGPGIRTTVFLKGCPLDCWWCHNPEGRSPEVELSVAESRCIRCGRCGEVCPEQDGPSGAPAGTEPDRCTRCGRCVAACPTEARQMVGRSMSSSELVAELLKDRIFYDESQGGVTFSGGEPLAQPEFLAASLRACRSEGIHTAVDTCGYGPQDVLLSLAPLVDLFLYDLKTVDERLHVEHTGVSNAAILDNLRALGRVHEQIWLRVPVIAGLNDNEAELEAIARLAREVPGVRQVHLLPYHELGSHKTPARSNGRPRPAPLPTERLEEMADRYRSFGITTRIGG